MIQTPARACRLCARGRADGRADPEDGRGLASATIETIDAYSGENPDGKT